jgi:hypothetical protein
MSLNEEVKEKFFTFRIQNCNNIKFKTYCNEIKLEIAEIFNKNIGAIKIIDYRKTLKHISENYCRKQTTTLEMSTIVYSSFLFVRPCHRVVHVRVSLRNNQNGYQTSIQTYNRQKEDEKIYPPSIGSL